MAATIAFALSGVIVAARNGLDAVGMCVVVTAGLRGLALRRNWELPAWRV